jgi:hypothetical protein
MMLETPARPNRDGVSVVPAFRRVSQMDLTAMWPWLGVRLMDRYPLATERQIYSHLLGCMSDNDCFFVGNDTTIGLFSVLREHFVPPYIKEQFCLCPGGAEGADAIEVIYEVAADWARRMQIRDFHYMTFSDLSSDAIIRKATKCVASRADKVRVAVCF